MKSGRKAGVGLLVTVVVLVGLVVLADRGAAWAAEDRIADQVAMKANQQNITMRGEPDVAVKGFPFLTQVFAGKYQAITIRMEQLNLNGVRVESLDVRATDVKAALGDVMNGSGEVRAARVTGEATVPFSAIAELVGYEGATVNGRDGKLLIRVPLRLADGQVEVTARARAAVSVADGVLTIDVENVTLEEGELPGYLQGALDQVADDLSRRIPLPELPYGLVLESAEVTGAGVVATASGRDVALVS